MRKLVLLATGLLVMTIQLWAQSTVSGVVTDSKDGSPLNGVSITGVGTKVGVKTDNDGRFTIAVPAGVKALQFSFVGFQNFTMAIAGQTAMNVSLSRDENKLDEVVVVGYGTQKKKELTGSIATVKGAAVANKPVQSFEQALGGRAAGVQVTIPSGVLNAPPVLRIRGTNSISLSSYPLIVIDGVPVFTGDASGSDAAGNALASINPNDIESIDVAKDAAASAIYGSRAANGVLFITLKKGKQGKAKVTVDSWFGWSNPQRFPELLNAQQYTDHKNEALRNANLFSATNQFGLTTGADGKAIDTKWNDYVYRQGFQHSQTVSVSGATDATNYYFSAGYTDQAGIIRRNDFRKMSALMNVEHRVGKILSLGGKLQYSNERNLAATSSGSLGDAFATAGLGRVAFVTAPNVGPYNLDGSYNTAGGLIGVQGNKVGQVGFYNPVITLDNNRSNSENNHFQSNVFVQLKPIKGVTLRSAYGIDYVLVNNEFFASPVSGEGFSANGSATSSYNANKRWVWTNTAQFDYTLFTKHNFSLLAGQEQQKSDNNGFGLNRINISDPAFSNIQGGFATPNTAGLAIGENYLTSVFGRLQYNFDRKYLLSGNIRRDGASQLGLNQKYGTFWGVSAGWEVAQENFWHNWKLDNVFSTFRLRASYGKVGNISGLGNFQSLSTYSSGLYGGNPTVTYSQAGNPDLTWETSNKTDVGVSMGFFKDRLTAEIDWYKNDINGLLLFVPQPPSAGLPSTIPQNIGTMYNKGLEFAISGTPILKKDFSWTSNFNISFNENKVTSLAAGLSQVLSSTGGLESPSITRPGYPIGMLFVTQTNGVDPASGRRIFINSQGRQVFFQHVAPAGQFRFSYADGTVSPTVSSADAVVFKQTNPKFYGGWENTFRWKGFDLGVQLTFQGGNYIYFGSNAGLRDQRFWNNSTDILRKWQKAGDVTDIPRAVFGDNISNGSSFPLDINVFKGDFIKVRNLTFGYTLPKTWLNKLKISNARIYGTGNNLFFITDYPGPDPEVSSNGNGSANFGVDRNTVVNSRTLTVGINLTF